MRFFAECLLLVVITMYPQACTQGQPAVLRMFDTEGNGIYQRVVESAVPWDVIGRSVEGREIFKKEFGRGDSTVLVIGGFHGSEIRGVELALAFAEHLYENGATPQNTHVVVVPVLNPDGLVRQQRVNANGVDINRNFPTDNWSPEAASVRNNPGSEPASEPETRIAMDLVAAYDLQRIVSIHAPLEIVNYDGPARLLAEKMAEHNGYMVSGDIGYPTPGSFGNFAGVEKHIPTITLELPDGPFAPMWEANRDALLAAISF